MKTKEQFDGIVNDFFNTVHGKTGGTFFVAILEFMDKHKFQNKIINHLYESEHECVYFFTDHLLNDVGIVTVEVFGKQFICYVGSKKEAQNIIQNRLLK